ncbi:MAG TPA: hypothetical protein VGE58_12860 [Daejeonella sp.]
MKNKLNTGVKPVKGKALCLSEDEKKHFGISQGLLAKLPGPHSIVSKVGKRKMDILPIIKNNNDEDF